jgi:hypothetical protein
MAACQLEKMFDQKGWVCLDDAREVTIANRSVPNVDDWQPRGLLQKFYRSTGERIPHSRQTKWKPWPAWPQASEKYPEVWEALS